MKISKIEIQNFKSIRQISFENVPDFVAIGGPNGVGKTAILEAIRLVKGVLYPYETNENQWAQNQLTNPNIVRKGKSTAKILLKINPTTEDEEKLLATKEAEIGLIFQNNRWETYQSVDCRNIFKQPKEGHENTLLEYISAYRIFQEGPVNLQVGQIDESFFRDSRTGQQVQNKFSKLKQTILGIYADDKLVDELKEKRFPEIVKLVKKLLNREIIVKFQPGVIGNIFVKNEDGMLELDSLSSGEREILMTYFTLHSLRLKNSIILFDEPDLHLHPSSQHAVYEYLRDMSMDNQVILTTHSSELISLIPDESLFHLKRLDKNQLVNIKEETDKLSLYESLGSSKFNFIAYDKTIFVEGPLDKKILSKIDVKDGSLKFEIFHGGSNLTPKIIETISKLGRVVVIKDRDFYSSEEIQSMQSQVPGKLYFWSRREIENFFLDSEVLFEVNQSVGKNEFGSFNNFKTAIKTVADKYLQQTISDKFLFQQHPKLNPPQPVLDEGGKAVDLVKSYYQTRNQRTLKLISKLDNKVSEVENETKSDWDLKWVSDVDPKLVLNDIAQDFFDNQKSRDDVMDMIILKLDSNTKFPSELVAVIQQIASS